jgi:hypothetical protein
MNAVCPCATCMDMTDGSRGSGGRSGGVVRPLLLWVELEADMLPLVYTATTI